MKIYGIALPRAEKRLTALFSECLNLAASDKKIIADIGADHGYLACMLCKSGKFKKVIATDISAQSLEKTKKLAQEHNLEIDCRVGDGLIPAQDAQICAICGMGGQEIAKILQNSPQFTQLVLQPVQNVMEIRQFLLKNGYKIAKDYVIEDKNKFYYIIVTNGKGLNFYTKTQKYFGKNPKNSVDFKNYLLRELKLLSFLENFDITKVANKTEIKGKIWQYNLIKKTLKKQERNIL